MTLEKQVLEKLRELSPQKQLEVLAFVSHLEENAGEIPRRSLLGLWKDLGADVSEGDIEQARREMWQGFPRDAS